MLLSLSSWLIASCDLSTLRQLQNSNALFDCLVIAYYSYICPPACCWVVLARRSVGLLSKLRCDKCGSVWQAVSWQLQGQGFIHQWSPGRRAKECTETHAGWSARGHLVGAVDCVLSIRCQPDTNVGLRRLSRTYYRPSRATQLYHLTTASTTPI